MYDTGFDPLNFLPYLLNQAADTQGLEFQKIYKSKYGMLRTEWRVLFHLGCSGAMTAKEICDRGRLHKTKVSRAVSALERKRFVQREDVESDRRSATLHLTRLGQRAFGDLSQEARSFDKRIRKQFTEAEAKHLIGALQRLSGLDTRSSDHPNA